MRLHCIPSEGYKWHMSETLAPLLAANGMLESDMNYDYPYSPHTELFDTSLIEVVEMVAADSGPRNASPWREMIRKGAECETAFSNYLHCYSCWFSPRA